MNKIPTWLYEMHIAHRGYFNEAAPENSLKAFERAIHENFAIEMDVQITSDDVLVVFHDGDLERMTGMKGQVAEINYDVLQTLTLLNTDQKVPTFKEFLNLVDGQVPLMIEFKNETSSNKLEKKAYDLLKDYSGEYIIQSFNPNSLRWFKKNAPSVIRGQLSYNYRSSNYGKVMQFILRNMLFNVITKPDYIIYDIKNLDERIIKRIQKRSKPLFGYTAKSKDAYNDSLNKGVRAVFEGFDPRL